MEPNRNNSIDLIKSISLILMIMTHSARLVDPMFLSYGLFGYFIKYLFILEPIISAAFVFTSGFSLMISYEKNSNYKEWLSRKKTTALKLIGMGSVLFFFEYGLQFPDIIVSSNILSCIGFSMLLGSFLMKRQTLITPVNILLLIVSLTLWQTDTMLPGLASGPGILLPGISFFLLGMSFARLDSKEKVSILKIYGMATVFLLILGAEWVTQIYQSYDPSMSYFREIKSNIRFWNHTFVGFFGYSFLIMIIYKLVELRNKSYLINRIANILLFSYLFHLFVISIIYSLGIKLKQYSYFGFVFLVVIILYDLSKTNLVKKIEKKLK